MALTGVAAINISVTTIYSELFHVPVGNFKNHLPALNDKMKSSSRNTFSKVKSIIIDNLYGLQWSFFHIHLRLLEHFGCPSKALFEGLSVILVGDYLIITIMSNSRKASLCRVQWQLAKYSIVMESFWVWWTNWSQAAAWRWWLYRFIESCKNSWIEWYWCFLT